MTNSIELKYYPNPCLFHKCKNLKRVDSYIKDCITEMRRIMEENDGIGLSATQVGLPFKLFITNFEELPVVINPEIHYKGRIIGEEEGCLSFPGLRIKVNRHEKIELSAYDLNGNCIDRKINGLLSRVVQHEADHNFGLMMTQRASSGQQEIISNKLKELIIKFEFHSKQKEWDAFSSELESKYC